MKAALEAAGLDSRATLYSCRHTYASRAIEAGVPLLALAKAMGTSTMMLEKTYAHLLVEREREFAERAAMNLGIMDRPKAGVAA
jgi:integrase